MESTSPKAQIHETQGTGKKVLLANPRGYCAGVDRAVITVEKALELYGAPVYVRKQIVHNVHVVRTLEQRGAIFVEETEEVPEGAIVVFSAHGVAPVVHEEAKVRNLKTIDATCPLVTKVHHEARRFASDGYRILLIGHEGHEEVEGTAGEAPDHITLVETPDDVAGLEPRDPARLAFITQTTLSVDDTAEVVAALRARFPAIIGPHKEDICYATTNRQAAVKKIAPLVQALLVIGAPNSSNSQRLVEVARRAGCGYAQLIQRAADIDWRAIAGIRAVGITAGASAPEVLIEEVIDAFRARHAVVVEQVETAREDVEFKVPRIFREKVA